MAGRVSSEQMRRVSSIKFKSNLFVLFLILATVGILSVLSLTGIKHYQEAELESYLATQARTANVMVGEGLNDQSARAVLRQMTADPSMRAGIYDRAGKLVRESSFLALSPSESENVFQSQNRENQALKEALKGKIAYRKLKAEETKGDPLVDYYAPLYSGETQIGVLRLTYRYQSYLLFYRQMLNQTVVTSVAVFLVSAIAGLWYFGRQANRMARLKTAVEAVAQTRGEMNDEIEILAQRRDEYGVLARSVSQMGETIKTQFESLEQEQMRLMLAVDRLREMEMKQRQFFGNITHEFKTPLSVIYACNDLAAMYPDDRELLMKNQRQTKIEVQKLNGMIENALELAKTERYDFEVQWETLDFVKLCETVIQRLSVKASKYKIEMSFKSPKELCSIRGDAEAIGQILTNLIDNAIKYNRSEGRIDMKLTLGVVNNTNYWQFWVSDEGAGMNEVQVENLFMAYAGAGTSNLTEVKGSGLGLALSHKLAAAMNGRLYLSETGDEGSTFIFELPQNEKV